MRVRFKVFESGWLSWDDLLGQAAQFATDVGPHRLITVSHSEDQNQGVVTVWYWDEEDTEPPADQAAPE